MQKPYVPAKEEHHMICPDCGSTSVNKDPSNEVKIGDKKLEQYICSDCKASFIPAMVGKDATKVEKWAKKMSTQMELNEGLNFKKAKDQYIIIKEIPLIENITLTRNDVLGKVLSVLASNRMFNKQGLIREVASDILNQSVSTTTAEDETKALQKAEKLVQKLLESLK